MRRTAFCLVLVALLSSISAAQLQQAAINVMVFNRARMKQQTLISGEQQASRLLQRAGVGTLWLNCPIAQQAPGDRCEITVGAIIFTLTIAAKPLPGMINGEQLGVALQEKDGTGFYCYIFRSRLDELSGSAHIDPTRLLGAAIAHELGHLLMGEVGHSPSGLMSAHWGEREIRAAERGGLVFTAKDIARIDKWLRTTQQVQIEEARNAIKR
jgi:hypothetical protein